MRSVCRPFLAAAAFLAATAATAGDSLPRPGDVATIDGMVRAFYEVVSGPAGQKRDWARDRSLYIDDIRFVIVRTDPAGKPDPKVVTHQQFVESAGAVLAEGFYETEVHRVTERFGPIAHVWSTYEGRRTPAGPAFLRGINSIELFWDGKRWWISNAIWTDETKENPVPKEYLPK